MERRLTPRGRERRRQLMDHAARAFAEGGYHPTSVAEIVEGLGVGKGVFYWYFASKEELFLEILRETQHDLRRVQQAAISRVDDPLRRIEIGIRVSLRWLVENRHLATLIAFASTEERFAPTLRANAEIAVEDAARHMRDAIAAHHIADADPTLLAHAVLGVTDNLARFLLDADADPDRVADAAIAFCMDGLLGAARQPA